MRGGAQRAAEAVSPAAALEPEPIFVLGIRPRCGTNFVANLLCLHPDCAYPAPIWEDSLLREADLLFRFSERLQRAWDPGWGVGDVRAELHRALGDGLIRFLQSRAAGRRIVTKTPHVDNIARFFELFPRARLVIVVRDGRSVVESGAASFGWSRELAMRRWTAAARAILAFAAADRGPRPRHLVVRYEDLWRDREGELRRILRFAALDEDRYDFAAAARLPIRGSSQSARGARGLHWDPVEPPADFDPTARFAGWPRRRHARFEWMAAAELRALGYAPIAPGGPRALWALYHGALDGAWAAIRWGASALLRKRIR